MCRAEIVRQLCRGLSSIVAKTEKSAESTGGRAVVITVEQHHVIRQGIFLNFESTISNPLVLISILTNKL